MEEIGFGEHKSDKKSPACLKLFSCREKIFCAKHIKCHVNFPEYGLRHALILTISDSVFSGALNIPEERFWTWLIDPKSIKFDLYFLKNFNHFIGKFSI